MKPKDKPASKIPTSQKNTNQKKKVKKSDNMGIGGSLLKKNEFTLIIAGALVATLLVFFIFFRSSDSSSGFKNSNQRARDSIAGQNNPRGTGEPAGLENRIAALELGLSKLASSSPVSDQDMSAKGIAPIEQRVARLETTLILKFDSLIERMGKMEKQVASLKRKSVKPAPVVKVSKARPKTTVKTPVKKKAAQSGTKSSLFHTVQKGETLWSISQRYKTTVAAIRKLNNLTAGDDIYPGNNILVR